MTNISETKPYTPLEKHSLCTNWHATLPSGELCWVPTSNDVPGIRRGDRNSGSTGNITLARGISRYTPATRKSWLDEWKRDKRQNRKHDGTAVADEGPLLRYPLPPKSRTQYSLSEIRLMRRRTSGEEGSSTFRKHLRAWKNALISPVLRVGRGHPSSPSPCNR